MPKPRVRQLLQQCIGLPPIQYPSSRKLKQGKAKTYSDGTELPLFTRLSPKMRQIVLLVGKGLRNREIARECGTTEQGIKNYLRQIFERAAIATRLELVLKLKAEQALLQAPAQPLPAPPQPQLCAVHAIPMTCPQCITHHFTLTPRQKEVIHMILAGRADAEIAQAIGIRTKSVKHHIKHLFLDYRVHNRVQLALAVLNEKGDNGEKPTD